LDDEIGHGLKWSAISAFSVRALQGIRSLVIARVVGPKSVGSFAAAFAFVSLASLVAEFGLQSFLIQRGRDARAEARVVGEIALAMGIASSVALVALARPIASFYDDPAVSGLLVGLVASVLLTSLTVVPNALLRAEFRFDAVARVAVAAEIAACFAGIGMAMANAGVWSLVGAALTSQSVTFIGLLWARPEWHRIAGPRAHVRRNALRFGLSVAGGSAVWTFALQGDNVMVGRVLGATALGLYAFAYNYGVLPGALIGSTVTDVALAGFSNERSDRGRVALFTQLVRVGAAIASPLVFVAMAIAPAAIRIVLGSEWVGATRPLQVILVVGWIRGVLPTESLLRSKGLVKVELKVGLVAAPATIVAAYLGAQASLTLAALAVGSVLIVASLVATWIALAAVNARLRVVVAASHRAAAVSALCALPLILNNATQTIPDAFVLFAVAPASVALAFVAMWRLLPTEWASITRIVRSRRETVRS
jgi:PST family polysaccharide transporter